MLRALAVISVTSLFVFSAGAQSYVESNAIDTVCEWQYKDKRGIDKCHIIAMGTHAMNTNVLMFTIDNMVVSLVDEDGKRSAEIGTGGFWDFQAKWKGSYTDKFRIIEEGPASVNTIKLSNGYKIKLVY
ncbi:MAG: hypothetical protein ACKOPU_00735 [Candidatus Planktophila sp.]